MKALTAFCPRLCNITNEQGQTPLVLFMFALARHEQKELVNNILALLAGKTMMDDWKNPASISRTNSEKLGMLEKVKKSAGFFKKYGLKKLAAETLGPAKRDAKYKKAFKRWDRARVKAMKKCEVVSPVEAAVLCKRADWLGLCLDAWQLSGDIVTNGGRHVLGLALEGGDEKVVESLMKMGTSRFCAIKGSARCFDMDGVFVAAYQGVYREMFAALNRESVAETECGSFNAYNEYLMKSKEPENSRERSYRQAILGKVSPTSSAGILAGYKHRLDVLNAALKLYLGASRIQGGVAPVPRKSWGKEPVTSESKFECTYHLESAFIPLQDPKYVFLEACKIPELSPLLLQMMYEG